MERRVEETVLPGVGVRFAFHSATNQVVSVVHHHSGRREVFVATPDDPDASREILDLAETDAQVLSELLGGSRVHQELDRMRQKVQDVALDWLPVEEGSAAIGRAIEAIGVRQETGVVIAAVLRGEEVLAAPGPDFVLQAGDTVVVAGTGRDCDRARDLFSAAG